jgi:hypothetical protein
MKTATINLFFALMCLFLNGCIEKIFGDTIFTIEGVLYDDCNMKPVPNINLEIWDTANNSAEKGYGKTNDKGEFKIEFKGTLKGNYSVNAIPANGGGFGTNEVGTFVPQTQNITGYKAYFDPQTIINIKLQTNRVFTQNDTLYLYVGGSREKVIAPQNGQLLSTDTGSRGMRSGYTWGLGYAQYQESFTDTSYPRSVTYYYPDCGVTANYVIVIP